MVKSEGLATLQRVLVVALCAVAIACGGSDEPAAGGASGAGDNSQGGDDQGGSGQGGAGRGDAGQAGAAQSGKSGASPANPCTPGKSEACPCVGTSETGVQVCQADGTFAACQGCPQAMGGNGGSSAGGGGGSGAGAQAGTAGVGGSGGVGGVASSFPCLNPQPVLRSGQPTGYDSCSNGGLARKQVLACPPYVPSAKACAGGMANECKFDSDCTMQAKGRCDSECYCEYGSDECQQDSDCGSGKVCECGYSTNTCVPAVCHSSKDCAVGDCLLGRASDSCGDDRFECQSPQDTCGPGSSCKYGCTYGSSTSSWSCGGPCEHI